MSKNIAKTVSQLLFLDLDPVFQDDIQDEDEKARLANMQHLLQNASTACQRLHEILRNDGKKVERQKIRNLIRTDQCCTVRAMMTMNCYVVDLNLGLKPSGASPPSIISLFCEHEAKPKFRSTLKTLDGHALMSFSAPSAKSGLARVRKSL